MSGRVRLWPGRLLAGAIALGVGISPSIARAQATRGNVSIVLPQSALRGDTLRSVTPTLVVQATGFTNARPLQITLQIDTTPRFSGNGLREFERTISSLDSTVTIAPVRALIEGSRSYFRAMVSDPQGVVGMSAMIGPFFVPPWVSLVTPPDVVAQPVRTRRPRFVWRSPTVLEPPGPWAYSITITNIGRQQSTTTPVGSDTTFVPPSDLEANAVYTWSISSRLLGSSQSSIVISPVNFVVEDASVPTLTTSLSPPFPNPFPNPLSDVSCIWFDLRSASNVFLDVYDLRGVHVRRLVPNAEVPGELPAGPYGRGRAQTNEGCDPRFAWNGTDDRGRTVPEGVYIIRFKGDGREFTRKVLFRGRP